MKICGQKLAIHVRNKFDYLGVALGVRGNGSVAVSTFKYFNTVLEDFQEKMGGKAATLVANQLFNMQGEGVCPLSLCKAEVFHLSTA